MQIRGIKRGSTIELSEELGIPDGHEIMLEISLPTALSPEEHWQRLSQILGAWADQPDLDAIFGEMTQQRHQYDGRNVWELD